MSINRLTGCVFLVAATCIGAGFLALPMVAAAVGYRATLVGLVLAWLVMLHAAWFILEVSLALPLHLNNFHSMARTTLGPIGIIVNWLAFTFALYAAMTAFTMGNATLLNNIMIHILHISLPPYISAILSVLLLGAIVAWHTQAVDYCVRGLVILKLVLLFVVFASLLPSVNISQINQQPTHFAPLWKGLPIMLACFSYHVLIPTMVNYAGKPGQRHLPWVLTLAITIPLLIFIVWVTLIMSIIPLTGSHGFAVIAAEHNSIAGIINSLHDLLHNNLISVAANVFVNITMVAVFLSIGLSLFDFIIQNCRLSKARHGRIKAALLTFAPPLLIALFYSNSFIYAMQYVGFAITILLILMPPVMVYRLRKLSPALTTPFRVYGAQPLIFLMITIGAAMTGLALLMSCNLVEVPALLR